ncbi:MAG: aminopeptidase P family protein [Clostridia bacterium]|nr:aminopeptidase P family protein [Clostridia bacterium]
MNQQRLNRVIDKMKMEGFEELIISAPNAIYYLLDEMFSPGERLLTLYVNTSGVHKLLINALFPNAKGLDTEVIFYNDKEDPVQILSDMMTLKGKVGIDKEWPSHFLIRLMEKQNQMKIGVGSICVDYPRMLKDADEIKKMRHASQINDTVMSHVAELLGDNQLSEKELQKKIPELFEQYETFEVSFTPSVSYGDHTAIPHHESDQTKSVGPEALLIDMGGRTNGYCSDMTRSFYRGEPSEKYREVYNIVLKANLAGIAAVKPGVSVKTVDAAARKVIEEAGYGDYFTHRTGHGIGIEVHEFPDVSSASEMILEPGMTFSVEPGIYLPDEFGVRIEDIVLVTEAGCEVLNQYPKELKSF